MARLAAGVEYNGTYYHGWQSQAHSASVQSDVERAFSRVADEAISVSAAGRTDAGVHASGQVIHFDSTARRPTHGWMLGANVHLPGAISISWVREVDGDFHARFSAIGRRYQYVILSRRARSAIHANRVCWTHYPLDVVAMRRAAACLVGEFDFSAFRAAECQSRSPVREVRLLRVYRSGPFVFLDIEANAFLHHMVRNIAGALIAVGRGAKSPKWMQEVLDSRDRRACGATAPAEGLYLLAVRYPSRYQLPEGPSASPMLGDV